MYQKSGKRDSVSKKEIVFRVSGKIILMDFLTKQLPQKSRNKIKSLLQNKQVFVNEEPVSQFNYLLVPGQLVKISGSRSYMKNKFRDITIVYEDDDYILIDKAAGLLSVATKNERNATVYKLLSSYVKQQEQRNKIFIVHRLDRETSGLMIFAKNEKSKYLLQENWSEAVQEKTYVAVVEGEVEEREGTIVSYLSEDLGFRVH